MNNVLAALAEIGSIFKERVSNKVTEVNAPNIITKHIYVGSPMESGATDSIEITIDHPAAGAYEWGSGIHSTRGGKGKYPIPKEPGYIAFPKERWPQYNPDYYTPPRPAPDVFVFSQVMHPGVEKRPFIMPTINETREEFKQILGQGFKAELLAGKNRVEVIEVK